ncbi:hypothetical protein WJX73_005424 [Symbiochloris irregularis]|uniref:RNA helicase n=1 Tax=Symbiochloris irregularis TaxID=706552 RepID=A0AAW1NUF7_9CHLO
MSRVPQYPASGVPQYNAEWYPPQMQPPQRPQWYAVPVAPPYMQPYLPYHHTTQQLPPGYGAQFFRPYTGGVPPTRQAFLRLCNACKAAFPKLPEALQKMLAIYAALCLPENSAARECKEQILRYHYIFRMDLALEAIRAAAEDMAKPGGQARHLVSEGLMQLKVGFLSGEEMPADGFGCNHLRGPEGYAGAVERITAKDLDAAIVQVVQDPSLGTPSTDDKAQGAPPPPSPRLAEPCPLPQAGRIFLDSGDLQRLHKSALKDVSALQLGAAGIGLSANADFGVHRLVVPEVHEQPVYPFLYINGGAAQQAPTPTLFYRQLAAVAFDKGQLYPVTVLLDCSLSPKRKAEERGLLQQLVMFTFLVPHTALQKLPAGHACIAEVHEHPDLRALVVGRRVTVALTDQAGTEQRLCNLEAPPFVPAHLLTLFDSAPSNFIADPPPLFCLLGSRGLHKAIAWWSSGHEMDTTVSPPPPAYGQTGIANVMRKAIVLPPSTPQQQGTAESSAASKGEKVKQLRRYSRMLGLEEAAMEDHIRRHDMFNVRVQVAIFLLPNRYAVVCDPGNTDAAEQTSFYRGPNLAVVLLRNPDAMTNRWRDWKLLALHVPGLQEGRPMLLFGDVVYVRFASSPTTEYGGYVVATDGALCLAGMPSAFWQQVTNRPNLSGNADNTARRKAQMIHVRFSFDRSLMRRMHTALQAIAELGICFEQLPTDDKSGSDASKSQSQPQVSASSGPPSPLASQEALAAASVQLPQQADIPGAQADAEDDWPSMQQIMDRANTIQEGGAKRLNTEQRIAVASMLCGRSTAFARTSFALFGPPGTGKTVTLVEGALQVLHQEPQARLLLCAPSNYSADLLAAALLAAGQADVIVRLNDPRRPPAQVHLDVLPMCAIDDTSRALSLPSLEAVSAARVVICTCGGAGMLREGDYAKMNPPIRFSHVMIDEAGQALPTEALIPISLLHPSGGRVLLCGDPKQLGPIVRCPLASTGFRGQGSLGVSLLESFIAQHSASYRGLLDRHLAPCTVQLVRNYRSHSTLLRLPNALFYNDSLQAAADQRTVLPPEWAAQQLADDDGDESAGHESAAVEPDAVGTENGNDQAEDFIPLDGAQQQAEQEDGDMLQPKYASQEYQGDEDAEEEEETNEQLTVVSTLFYGVRGQQMREGEGPSYFNPMEATVLVRLLRSLLQGSGASNGNAQQRQSQGARVTAGDIGVIATYRKQVQKIRMLLRECDLSSVRVGTVDDFQGQEARIVFISTVLSRCESLLALPTSEGNSQGVRGGDLQQVGFWRNPKRFNVAITRARALLVVIGHPVVLLEDSSWRELLRHCASRGTYRGAGVDYMAHLARSSALTGAQDAWLGEESAPQLAQGATAEEGSLAREEAEMALAIERIADLALLGVGDADHMFPDTLDEAHSSLGFEELAWRVAL